MNTEMLTLDNIITSIALTNARDIENTKKVLTYLCNEFMDNVFIFGRTCKIYRSSSGVTTIISPSETKFEANIYLQPCNDPKSLLFIKYYIHNFNSICWLDIEYAPTTLLTGRNIFSATLMHKSKPIKNPSSSPVFLHEMFRAGFELLEGFGVLAGITPCLSFPTRDLIEDGREVFVVRVQFAGYKPTNDKKRFLQGTCAMYEQTIASKKSIINIANYMNIHFTKFAKDGELTGVMFQKNCGKSQTVSFSIYDKICRAEEKNQLSTLAEEEKQIIRNNLRYDMTTSRAGIPHFCRWARDYVNSCNSDIIRRKVGSEFLESEPKATLWHLEKAIYALSLYPTSDGVIRKSFGHWLIPYMQDEIVKFPQLAYCNEADFLLLSRLDHPVAKAWRTTDYSEDNWATILQKNSSVCLATIYNTRKKWVEKFKIDILLPYAVYRDLLFFAPNTFSSEHGRELALKAKKRGDADAFLKLRRRSDVTFACVQKEMRKTLKSAPLSLPTQTPISSKPFG